MLHFCSTKAGTLVSTLLPTLSNHNKFATTGCSKGLQGLRFPLGDTGLFTGQYFRKVLVRDSDNIVKPFMHVAIQTTRHYAHLLIRILPNSSLHVAMQFGLYLLKVFAPNPSSPGFSAKKFNNLQNLLITLNKLSKNLTH